MKVYGVIGWHNAGKTTLVEQLVADFTARGLAVSTVKHSHHVINPDPPGTDTHRHRAAGARETLLASPGRFTLTHENHGPDLDLPALLSRLAPVDLVLVEGFKRGPQPRIEVWRAATSQPPIQLGDPLVRAIVTDGPLPQPVKVPVLDLNDVKAVAEFILADCGLQGSVTP